MRYSLPKSVELGGKEYAIRSDYRDILDILEMLSDSELDSADKAEAVMEMFYPDYEDIPYTEYENAVRQCISFINCGEEECRDEKRPKLMDWQQDFPMIASPINRVLGTEIRSLEYLHWWTFIAAYQEIGDCTFAQVVSIRKKKSKIKSWINPIRNFTSRISILWISNGNTRIAMKKLSINGYKNALL